MGYNRIFIDTIVPQSSREFKRDYGRKNCGCKILKYHDKAQKYQFDTLGLYFFF